MQLIDLSVELQREIYGYILCPGLITVNRLRSHCIACRPFTRQRSGRIPQWNVTPTISTYSSAAEVAVCEQLDTKIRMHPMDKGVRTSSRYLDYQVKRLLCRHIHDRRVTLVDCSPEGLHASTAKQARTTPWCACQAWPICSEMHHPDARQQCLRDMMLTQRHRQRGSDASRRVTRSRALDMSLLTVCKDLYTIAKDMVWEENVFQFTVQDDFESFLGMLSERQRSKLRKVQIVADVLMVLR